MQKKFVFTAKSTGIPSSQLAFELWISTCLTGAHGKTIYRDSVQVCLECVVILQSAAKPGSLRSVCTCDCMPLVSVCDPHCPPSLAELLQRGRAERGRPCSWNECGCASRRQGGDHRGPQDVRRERRVRGAVQRKGEAAARSTELLKWRPISSAAPPAGNVHICRVCLSCQHNNRKMQWLHKM